MTIADYVMVLVGVGMAGGGLLFVLSGMQHIFDGRRMKGLELTAVSGLEPGPVAVSGTAQPADEGAFSAPFSDRDCVAAEYSIREAQGKNTQTQTRLVEGTDTVPFYVDDGTGQVLVRPAAADLELETEGKTVVGREEEPPEPISEFLTGHDDIDEPTEPAVDLLGSGIGSRSFREKVIEEGEDVYVFGKATERQNREFGETDVVIEVGAAGGHSSPTTFIVGDQPRDEVAGGHESGGLLAILIGGLAVVFGSGVILDTPLI